MMKEMGVMEIRSILIKDTTKAESVLFRKG